MATTSFACHRCQTVLKANAMQVGDLLPCPSCKVLNLVPQTCGVCGAATRVGRDDTLCPKCKAPFRSGAAAPAPCTPAATKVTVRSARPSNFRYLPIAVCLLAVLLLALAISALLAVAQQRRNTELTDKLTAVEAALQQAQSDAEEAHKLAIRLNTEKIAAEVAIKEATAAAEWAEKKRQAATTAWIDTAAQLTKSRRETEAARQAMQAVIRRREEEETTRRSAADELERESRQVFVEAYLRASLERRMDLERGLLLANQANNKGSLRGFIASDQQLAADVLKLLGHARLTGFVGQPYADKLLEKLVQDFGGPILVKP